MDPSRLLAKTILELVAWGSGGTNTLNKAVDAVWFRVTNCELIRIDQLSDWFRERFNGERSLRVEWFAGLSVNGRFESVDIEDSKR